MYITHPSNWRQFAILWSNPNNFYQDTIYQIFIQTSFSKIITCNYIIKYCKTLHYLLDKAKIENKSHLIFSQKVCGKQDENVCKRSVISVTFTNVNHRSFSQINHMSTKISWLAQPECVWSQLVQGFVLQKLCQTT